MDRTSDLVAKTITAQQKKARLEVENELLKKSNNNSLAQLKARCEKLSIQVHGKFHNAQLFNKEIAALSTDEIKSRLTLPWQKGTGKPKPSAASRRRVFNG